MSRKPAARVGDPIGHSMSLAGMAIGMFAGVAIGAALVGATIATGGLALVAAVGAGAAATSALGLTGMAVGAAFSGPTTGALVTGSTNVRINGRFATMTQLATATCSQHPGPQMLATGSSSVKINGLPAGREGEKLSCSAKVVAKCSPDVNIGGPAAADPAVAISPEVPAGAVTALSALGLAGGLLTLPYALATLGVAATVAGGVGGTLGSMGGGAGMRAAGEAMGMTPEGVAAMESVGQLGGGMIGGGAGVRGAQRVLPRKAPNDIPMTRAEFDRIRTLPRGKRPSDPRTYLGDAFVDKHLAKFEDGGSYLMPTSVLNRFGRDRLGRPDGQFIMPKAEMDALMHRTQGNIGKIEQELGIPKGQWDVPGATLSRIDISNPSPQGLRMPNGNEQGANQLWLPGGRLPDGGSEAVVNQIPGGLFKETIIGGPR